MFLLFKDTYITIYLVVHTYQPLNRVHVTPLHNKASDRMHGHRYLCTQKHNTALAIFARVEYQSGTYQSLGTVLLPRASSTLCSSGSSGSVPYIAGAGAGFLSYDCLCPNLRFRAVRRYIHPLATIEVILHLSSFVFRNADGNKSDYEQPIVQVG